MPDTPPIVLVFSATDPTGGAGMQADILTLASMGCHPLSVVTAVTVQDTMGVDAVFAMDADWIIDQARCVLEDMPVAAFKIGVMGSVDNISAIAEVVSDYPDIPLILDPVLASGRGDELASDDMLIAMRELLIPQTTIITPNSLEARRLALDERNDKDDPNLAECARRIVISGCEYVLVTGTHEKHARGYQYALQRRRRGGQRIVAALAGAVSRFRLHAGVSHCRHHRQRLADGRGGQRRARIHVANVKKRLSPRHGPAHS